MKGFVHLMVTSLILIGIVVFTSLLVPQRLMESYQITVPYPREIVYYWFNNKHYFKLWQPFQDRAYPASSMILKKYDSLKQTWASIDLQTAHPTPLLIRYEKTKAIENKSLDINITKQERQINCTLLLEDDSPLSTTTKITLLTDQIIYDDFWNTLLSKWQSFYNAYQNNHYLSSLTLAKTYQSLKNISPQVLFEMTFSQDNFYPKKIIYLRDTVKESDKIYTKIYALADYLTHLIQQNIPYTSDSFIVKYITAPQKDHTTPNHAIIEVGLFIGDEEVKLLRSTHHLLHLKTIYGQGIYTTLIKGSDDYARQAFDTMKKTFPLLNFNRGYSCHIYYNKFKHESNVLRRVHKIAHIQ